MLTVGLILKIGLTITNILREIDLVLGINWLHLVNPMIDWCGAKIHVPNAVHTALPQGNWLVDHVHAGAMTMLSNEKHLQKMNKENIEKKLAILKCPRF